MSRLSRYVLVAAVACLGAAVPASAAPPDLSDEVTVRIQGPINCVTEPCEQPPLLTVCVVRLNTCFESF